MDPIRRDDVDAMQTTTAAEKARQALSLMRSGIELKRAGLRDKHPNATEQQIEEMLREWLETDD